MLQSLNLGLSIVNLIETPGFKTLGLRLLTAIKLCKTAVKLSKLLLGCQCSCQAIKTAAKLSKWLSSCQNGF